MTTKLKYWRKDANWLPSERAIAETRRLSADLPRQGDVRSRWKTARALTHAAASLAYNDEPLTIARVEESLAALTVARRNGGATEFIGKAASFLARERLALLGLDEPETVFEKRKRIHVDTGTLAVGTSVRAAWDWLGLSGAASVEALNVGNLYAFGIGGDGSLTVRLRMVSGHHPVLTAKEYTAVDDVAPVGYLATGTLLAGEPGELGKGIKLSVDRPVLVQPFAILRGYTSSVIIVVCEAEDRPEPLQGVPELHL